MPTDRVRGRARPGPGAGAGPRPRHEHRARARRRALCRPCRPSSIGSEATRSGAGGGGAGWRESGGATTPATRFCRPTPLAPTRPAAARPAGGARAARTTARPPRPPHLSTMLATAVAKAAADLAAASVVRVRLGVLPPGASEVGLELEGEDGGGARCVSLFWVDADAYPDTAVRQERRGEAWVRPSTPARGPRGGGGGGAQVRRWLRADAPCPRPSPGRRQHRRPPVGRRHRGHHG